MIKILDLYCGGGGCSMGYHLALKELAMDHVIVGVDIEKQPNYPFEFIQSDAKEYMRTKGNMFDFCHASPPCQEYSVATADFRKNKGKVYSQDLIEIRDAFRKMYQPSVIENVPGAPIRHDIVLSGVMFGLKVIRVRKFEVNGAFCLYPQLPAIRKGAVVKFGDYISIYDKRSWVISGVRYTPPREKKPLKEIWRKAMGIDWMTTKQLTQAIPPAYTQWIGNSIFPQLFNKFKK